jgi:6-phosphofructokinase 1
MARFAVLTSGGDAPGMNAVIYGVHDEATAKHAEIVGIPEGFKGLASGDRIELAEPVVSPAILSQAGTILRTSRQADLRLGHVVADCVASLSRLGIDGLVVIGGAGSLRGVERLRVSSKVPIAFVPATIDNDIEGSEETIGFDSAVDYGVAAVDSLRVTAESLLHRAFLVEVLGANCGRIAEAIAAATPIDVLIVPERPLAQEDIARRMREALNTRYAIAVMTEGCGEAGAVARDLGEIMGARVRPTVLGHSQRGARPTARDRRLGLACGRSAVSALLAGTSGDVVVRRGAPTLRPVGSPSAQVP